VIEKEYVGPKSGLWPDWWLEVGWLWPLGPR